MTNPYIQKAMQLKEKNLQYFKGHQPGLFQVVKSVTFEHLTLNIDTKTGKLDILDGNTPLYQGDAQAYAQTEVNHYLKDFKPGTHIRTVAPPQKGELEYHRFFCKRINKLVNSTPEGTIMNGNYLLPDFYPLMVFIGCGLGLHIQKMVEQSDIQNIIIFEPEPEYFYASLYVTDWEILFRKTENKGRTLDIILSFSPDVNSYDNGIILWNKLINCGPSFPSFSLFYNHQRSDKYSKIISRISEDMHYFLNQWGYYDDEINQYNNAFHNIAKGIPKLSKEKINKGKTAVIVGGGPSLDSRINEIIENREKITLISCGTAVHTLIKEGLVPDIQVEIESHMLTYEHLVSIENKDFHNNTLLVGAVQLPPNVFDIFKNKVYFFKDSTPLADAFIDNNEVVVFTTPTCTNTGVAIASKLGFSRIMLYGMDFGFWEKEKHHSKSSVYYSDNLSENIQKEINQTFDEIMEVESVFGSKIYSISMYTTSRKTVENCIIANPDIEFHNCSSGARIRGSYYIEPQKAKEILSISKNEKDEDKTNPFIGGTLDKKFLSDKISELNYIFKKMCKELSSFIGVVDSSDIRTLFIAAHQMNNHMLGRLQARYGRYIFSLRGSIWHYLHTGATISVSIRKKEEKEAFIELWKDSFRSFLKDAPDHFKKITSKDYPDNSDPWIRDDIVGNEILYHE
ncbi:motility associated factor glycosyltransferase family protein [Bacterioplanoides sp.]|uniref:motility associated factor glycosyltransferase family protein n=1 Tax=Bacterioplanoides sp. TaxID=2066072 RepID=UPI003AFFD3A0